MDYYDGLSEKEIHYIDEARIIGRTEGTVIGEKDGWYKIKSGSVTGYVKSEFVSIGDDECTCCRT